MAGAKKIGGKWIPPSQLSDRNLRKIKTAEETKAETTRRFLEKLPVTPIAQELNITKWFDNTGKLIQPGYTLTKNPDGTTTIRQTPKSYEKSYFRPRGKKPKVTKGSYTPHELTFNATGNIIKEIRRQDYDTSYVKTDRYREREGAVFDKSIKHYNNKGELINKKEYNDYKRSSTRDEGERRWKRGLYLKANYDYSKGTVTKNPYPKTQAKVITEQLPQIEQASGIESYLAGLYKPEIPTEKPIIKPEPVFEFDIGRQTPIRISEKYYDDIIKEQEQQLSRTQKAIRDEKTATRAKTEKALPAPSDSTNLYGKDYPIWHPKAWTTKPDEIQIRAAEQQAQNYLAYQQRQAELSRIELEQAMTPKEQQKWTRYIERQKQQLPIGEIAYGWIPGSTTRTGQFATGAGTYVNPLTRALTLGQFAANSADFVRQTFANSKTSPTKTLSYIYWNWPRQWETMAKDPQLWGFIAAGALHPKGTGKGKKGIIEAKATKKTQAKARKIAKEIQLIEKQVPKEFRGYRKITPTQLLKKQKIRRGKKGYRPFKEMEIIHVEKQTPTGTITYVYNAQGQLLTRRYASKGKPISRTSTRDFGKFQKRFLDIQRKQSMKKLHRIPPSSYKALRTIRQGRIPAKISEILRKAKRKFKDPFTEIRKERAKKQAKIAHIDIIDKKTGKILERHSYRKKDGAYLGKKTYPKGKSLIQKIQEIQKKKTKKKTQQRQQQQQRTTQEQLLILKKPLTKTKTKTKQRSITKAKQKLKQILKKARKYRLYYIPKQEIRGLQALRQLPDYKIAQLIDQQQKQLQQQDLKQKTQQDYKQLTRTRTRTKQKQAQKQVTAQIIQELTPPELITETKRTKPPSKTTPFDKEEKKKWYKHKRNYKTRYQRYQDPYYRYFGKQKYSFDINKLLRERYGHIYA